MERFAVAVQPPGGLPDGRDKRVVFHGVNKSGSLALARVVREAYYADQRAHEFFSEYMGIPRRYDDAVAIIQGAGRGHAFFIGHRLFNAVREPQAGRLVLTQVRHPLPRMVSVYHWLKHRHERVPGAPQVDSEAFPSLDEFVRRGRGVSHSQMNQFATGFESAAPARPKRAKPAEVYERAVEVLTTRVDWFGLAEYFEESIFTYAAICGLSSVQRWGRDDRNTGRQMVWDLPESTRAMIEDVYEYEFRFYAFARDLFLERIAKLRLEGDFEAYKAACATEYKDRLT
jgi:hypothetical protein